MTDKATGRIIRSLSGFYDVQLPGKVISCRARGILRKQGVSPLTGDMVEITVEHGKGMVERILPRKNSFVRPAVANMDALVVFAANVNPVTEPFLIDRVAAIAGDQEVQVVICVNKCDLDPGLDLTRIYRNAGFTVFQTSAETGEGVEELRAAIAGKLVAFTGNSGVGKSEAALELVKRGHRLIADDAVEIKRVSSTTLVGSAPEIIRHYVELRGIGIVDVRRIFGMGAVKAENEINLVVNIVPWNTQEVYDRLGLEDQYMEILGVKIPMNTIPITPGRNLAVILEVAAMNNRQKKMGYNAALEFTEQINKHFDENMR